MNGRAIPGAEMNTFRLTNVIPERIIFVSRGITVIRSPISGYLFCRLGELCLSFNPLNAELNPTCQLLALLGAHHILHVSRIRLNTRH